jgi:catechol 2,3-dioxygenase-like lactoylglutathione lyase family enzyme
MGCAAAMVLSASVFAAGQSGPKPVLTGVAHVALRVTNMEDELAFLAKLGFEMSSAVEKDGKVQFYFVKINDTEFIEVHPKIAPNGTPQPLGYNHICFVTNNANALYAQWAAAGLKPTDVSKGPDGTAEFGAKDPEGRLTEALEILPGSDPDKDKGKHLGAARVSTWLMGVDLPVGDVAAEQKFFEGVGFTGKVEGENVSLSAPGSNVRLVLRPAKEGVKPKLMFQIDETAKAAAALTGAGLKFDRSPLSLVVLDPDGNQIQLRAFPKL